MHCTCIAGYVFVVFARVASVAFVMKLPWARERVLSALFVGAVVRSKFSRRNFFDLF